MENKKKLGLYLHIPFCEKKCAYCDFYSLTGFEDFRRYADSMMLEMEDYSAQTENYVVDTVFIGGGTPSVMPTKFLCELIDAIDANFDLARDAEISMEVNPATVDRKKLKKLLRAGVNRLSIGLQSADDDELRALSRIHNYDEFLDAYFDARRVGFEDINVDLMYGIPLQTVDSLSRSIGQVCDLEPEHISLYGLKIEPGTPFADKADSLRLPDEDTEYLMYQTAVNELAAHGYEQYEISNFSRQGCRCEHNLRYWNGEEYLGIGPAAASYFGGMRYSNKRDIAAYMDAMETVNSGIVLRENECEVDEHDRRNEYIMLRLRLNEGLSESEYRRKFGQSFEETFARRLPLYLDNGFMKKTGDRYAFTTKGMFVSNAILADLVSFDRT